METLSRFTYETLAAPPFPPNGRFATCPYMKPLIPARWAAEKPRRRAARRLRESAFPRLRTRSRLRMISFIAN